MVWYSYKGIGMATLVFFFVGRAVIYAFVMFTMIGIKNLLQLSLAGPEEAS